MLPKEKAIDRLLNESNGSYKDLSEDAYDEGYKQALINLEKFIQEYVELSGKPTIQLINIKMLLLKIQSLNRQVK